MMDQEQAERFLEAAQADYASAWVAYTALMARGLEDDVAGADVRELRSDVLAAQQVLDLARTELHRAKGGAQQERVSAPERVPPQDQDGGLSTAQRAALVARYARLVDDLSTAGSPPQMDDLSARRTAYHEITGALGLRFVATEQGWALERVP